MTAVMHQFLGRVVLPRMKNAFSSKSSNTRSSSVGGSSVVDDVISGERRLGTVRLGDGVVDAVESGRESWQRDWTAPPCDMPMSPTVCGLQRLRTFIFRQSCQDIWHPYSRGRGNNAYYLRYVKDVSGLWRSVKVYDDDDDDVCTSCTRDDIMTSSTTTPRDRLASLLVLERPYWEWLDHCAKPFLPNTALPHSPHFCRHT